MDTDDKEFLREWLILNLEPVSDADPEVLSKYVLALVQNDPQTLDLQDTCVSKLEEFLGEETRGFVVKLFKALADGSYKASRVVNEAPRNEQSQAVNTFEDTNRRRDRTLLDEEDQRRYNKRGRDDDRPRDGDVKRHQGSPRRDLNFNRRQPYPSHNGGMRGGPVGLVGPIGGLGGRGPYVMGGDRPRNFPPEWGMHPQGMPPQGMWPPHFPPHRGAGFPQDFDPNGYMRENGGMIPHPHMMMPHPMVGGRGQFFPPGGRGGRGRRNFFAERSGKDGENGEASTAKTTLYVRHVDPKYVNMTMLSLHFSKFGNVVNVQMRPNAKCAFVQYATEDEAKKAFHSPLPVCNNRFISVKWARHDAQSPEEAVAIDQSDAGSKEASNNDPTVEKNAKEAGGEEESTDAMPENNMTTEELRAAALEKGRLVLEQKRELLEKQRTLKKQKEALIKRQLAQQKELLERMSANSSQFSIAEKRGLLDKITALSAELKALTPSHSAVSPSAVTRSVETGEGGENLNGLKAELSALEAEAEASGDRGGRGGRWSSSRGYRGGRGGRGRGRGGYGRGSHTLDNRTTIVKVANLPEEARDPIVLTQHFGNFGAVERVVMDEASPGQGFIKFQDRYAGQTAMNHGNVFAGKQLEMGWVESQEAPAELTRGDSPTETATASAVADSTATGTSDQVSASA